MKPDRKWVVVITACSALAGAFFAGRVWATGIPASGTLTYTGSLANPDGTPVIAASKNIGITAYDAATAGTIVPECTVASGPVGIALGQFQIQLPDTCSAKIQATPNLWIDVTVDGGSLGRTKLGAVPYAVEAGHAVNADAASGALETRLATLEASSMGKSMFRAYANVNQSTDNAKYTTAAFALTEFDRGGEFDGTTFSPKIGGHYDLRCHATWNIPSPGTIVSTFETFLTINDRRIFSGFQGDGRWASCTAQDVVKLAANDKVNCVVYQETGAQQSLLAGESTSFSAVRLAPTP